MKRNITIAYILSFAKNTWFWLGIWVFYYLRFTDYAGIGIIETVMIGTTTFFEIPTGAIADLLGKKKTLILSFLIEAIGGFLIIFATNLLGLAFSVFVMCIGGALYSGTLEALVFDSLIVLARKNEYEKTISNINSLGLVTPAICGVLGGWLYTKSANLPYILSMFGYMIGLTASIFLIEPKIDTIKFSFTNFTNQTKQGLRFLFGGEVFMQTILMLLVGAIIVIADEMLNGFLGVEFGFNASEMGVLVAIMYLVSAFGSQISTYFYNKMSVQGAFMLTGLLTAISLAISPISGTVMGGVSLIIRASMFGIFVSLSSVVINNNTESKYRATTISTFNMIKNLPYVILAYFVGGVSGAITARSVALYLGAALIILLIIHSLYSKRISKAV